MTDEPTTLRVPITWARPMPEGQQAPFWVGVLFDDQEQRWFLEISQSPMRLHPAHVCVLGPIEASDAATVDYAPFGQQNGIGWAVKQVWSRHSVRRRTWPAGKRLFWVSSFATALPYISVTTEPDGRMTMPWSPTQQDLHSLDWEIASP
jgi:hypothetical protein